MSEHTPGPWRLIAEDDDPANGWMLESARHAPYSYVIAMRPEWHLLEEARSNAHLIAKAWLLPELVEALRAITDAPGPLCLGHSEEEEPKLWCDCGRVLALDVLRKYDEADRA